jgi:protein-tyrosine phosphatase
MPSSLSDLDRHVPLGAAFNVRDLGGYPTADGRQVRWRTLFRADGLHRLDADDLEVLAGHGLRTVIDLRTKDEIEKRGRFPVDGLEVDYRHLPLIQTLWAPDDLAVATSAHDFLIERYLVMLEEGAPAIVAALGLLSQPATLPAVFHCAAGKDRTGVLAAVVLRVLGVEPDVVAADYALSAMAMERMRAWFEAEVPDAMAKQPPEFMAAPAEAMLGFLDDLDRLHGSVVDYVRGIGVTDDVLAALRAQLLE